MTDDQRVVCWLQLGLAQRARGRGPDEAFDEALALARAAPSDTAREAVAQIRFIRAEQVRHDYDQLAISGPTSKRPTPRETDRVLEAQLQARVDGLARVEQAYAEVIDTHSGPWAVEAFVAAGAAYESMAVALRESYVPPYLSQEQREIYEQIVFERAWLQDEKAVLAYTQALDTAWRLDLLGASARIALERRNALRPDTWPLLAESIPAPRFMARATEPSRLEIEP